LSIGRVPHRVLAGIGVYWDGIHRGVYHTAVSCSTDRYHPYRLGVRTALGWLSFSIAIGVSLPSASTRNQRSLRMPRGLKVHSHTRAM